MIILSIDVGIKNLAYCLFLVKDKQYLEIKDWGICNLSEETKYKCEENSCNRKVQYYKENKYYCKIHSKNQTFKIPKNYMKEKNIKKLLLCDLKKYLNITTKIKKKDCLNILYTDISNNYFNFIQKKNANKIDLVSVGYILKKKFNNLFSKEKIDHILIENQIGPLAIRMKVLQGMIIQYFIEKNYKNINIVSSSNKLKFFLEKNQKTTYKERKGLGISTTKKYLCQYNSLNNWLDFFNNNKKKDDLADSFLQGIVYLNKNNIIKMRLT